MVTACNGEDVHLGLIDTPLLEAKTILLPTIGGLLHFPLSAALTRLVATSSPHFALAVSLLLEFVLHDEETSGTANTTQLPAISLIGLGNFIPRSYGPTQIANPSPIVNVGATYNLNSDHASGIVPKIPPAPPGEGAPSNAKGGRIAVGIVG